MKKSPPPAAPDWLISEMALLSAIDPAVNPQVREPIQWLPKVSHADSLYTALMSQTEARPETVILAPWLQHGGADLGTLHHLRFCCAMGRKCLLILTRHKASTWLDLVPAGVEIIEMGAMAARLGVDDEDAMLVLARFLMQSSAVTIHNINSELGWRVIARFGRQLQVMGKKMFCSLFADEVDMLGNPFFYASDDFFLPAAPYLSGVFTDSESFRHKLQFRNGLPQSRLKTIYFPVDHPISETYQGNSEAKRVLWASRITATKLPDVLLKIAGLMPHMTFDVYGEFDHTVSDDFRHQLEKAPNVILNGLYKKYCEIASERPYAAFLYTSNQDGMPNVVLEALACGLPVIAPDVGGIPEVLGHAAIDGPLVGDCYDATEYAAKIAEVTGKPETGRRWWNDGIQKLNRNHTADAFSRSLLYCKNYL